MLFVSPVKLLIFDCDSTLSAIEGIDELARLRGPAVLERVAIMTNEAMDGKITVESVFSRRLDIIQPGHREVDRVGQLYVETVEPSARATIGFLKAQGWYPVILSGGFRQIIQPLADFLGIERIEAVDLFFSPDGNYKGFDQDFPTTRSGGKPLRINELRAELKPSKIIMVGDGGTDLETKPVVDLFIGFGRYVVRPNVKAGAAHFISDLAELPALLAVTLGTKIAS